MAQKVNKFKLNDSVKWTSQARGHTITKLGEVFAVVSPNEDAFKYFPDGTSRSQIQFDAHYAEHERYIVKVPRGGKSLKFDYYCPRVSQLYPV